MTGPASGRDEPISGVGEGPSQEVAEPWATWLTEWAGTEVGRKWLRQLADRRDGGVGAVPQLRKSGLSAPQASAVIELSELRQRAGSKFRHPERLFFTRRSYEQASGEVLAWRKVELLRRMKASPGFVILDLCCGCGGDLVTFARHFPVIGVDRDPNLVHFARVNWSGLGQDTVARQTAEAAAEETPGVAAICPALVLCSEVEAIVPRPHFGGSATGDSEAEFHADSDPLVIGDRHPRPERRLREWLPFLPPVARHWAREHRLEDHIVVWHLDPDRRDSQGRHTRIEALSPGIEFLERLVGWAELGFLKLAPATELSESWRSRAQWQWLGADRECKQLLGCFGGLGARVTGSLGVAVWRKTTQTWDEWPVGPAQTKAPRTGDPGATRENSSIPQDEQPNRNDPTDRAPYREFGDSAGNPASPLAYLFEPHAAFYAARLADDFSQAQGWQKLAGGDYYTAWQAPVAIGPLVSAFEVLATLPLRLEKVEAWLNERRHFVVEVKSRGVEEKYWKPLAKRLLTRGDLPEKGVSLLVFRQPKPGGQALRVAVCRRVVEPSGNR